MLLALFACTSLDNFSHMQTFRSERKHPIMKIRIGGTQKDNMAFGIKRNRRFSLCSMDILIMKKEKRYALLSENLQK